MNIKNSKGVAVDLLLILLAVGMALFARTFPRMEGSFSGPGSMPGILSVALAGLATLNLIQRWRKKTNAVPSSDSAAGNKRFLLLIGLVSAYLFLMPLAGFISSSAVFCALALTVFGYRNAVRAVAIGFVFAFSLYLVFGVLMNVMLPEGWIG